MPSLRVALSTHSCPKALSDTTTLPTTAESCPSIWDFWDDLQQHGQVDRKHMHGSNKIQLSSKSLSRDGVPALWPGPRPETRPAHLLHSGASVSGEQASPRGLGASLVAQTVKYPLLGSLRKKKGGGSKNKGLCPIRNRFWPEILAQARPTKSQPHCRVAGTAAAPSDRMGSPQPQAPGCGPTLHTRVPKQSQAC